MTEFCRPMIDALAACGHVLLTTHIRPDGDALGSLAAMDIALRAKGIRTTVLLLSHWPSKYAFVASQLGISHIDVEKGWPDDWSMQKFDGFMAVDTGTWSQLPGLKERLADFAGKKMVLDHHLTQDNFADVALVQTGAAAAAEIVAHLLKQWDIPLSKPLATALYVGIVSDTGWFQFSNTHPGTLRLAAELMEAGVDTDDLYQRLHQSERAQRVALQTRAMQSLELLANGRVAVMQLTRADFADSGANVPDTENLINIPLQIAAVQVSVLLTETLDGSPLRISLRSKGQVNVAQFAQQFGGGGHARAAGLKINSDLADAKHRILQALLQLPAFSGEHS